MSIREYSLRFNSLARYAPNVVATTEDRVHRYVDRLDPYLVRDCTIAALNRVVDIARIQAFAQKMEDQRQRRRVHEFERGPSKRARPMGQSMVSQGESRPRIFPRPPRPSFSSPTAGTSSQFRGFRGSHFGQSSGLQGSQTAGFSL